MTKKINIAATRVAPNRWGGRAAVLGFTGTKVPRVFLHCGKHNITHATGIANGAAGRGSINLDSWVEIQLMPYLMDGAFRVVIKEKATEPEVTAA